MFTVVTKLWREEQNFFLKMKGLDPVKRYVCEETGKVFSGALLMNAGLSLYHYPHGDGESFALHFKAE